MNGQARTVLRRVVFCLFSVLLLVAFSGGVLWLKMLHNDRLARVEIQKRLDAIRAAGQPLTAEDLAKIYPDPPPEHDAAILLNPAFSTLVFPDDSTNLPIISVDLPAHFTPLGEATVAEMRWLLATNQSAFVSVPWDKVTNAWFGSGFSAGFPSIKIAPAKLTRLARMECLEAIDRAEAGDAASATTALLHGLALRKTLPADTLVKHLIGRTIEETICATLERTINRTKLSTDDLLPLETALADDNAKNLNEVFVNLRCELIWEMEIVRKNPWTALTFDNTWKGKTVSWFNVAAGKAYRDSDFELMLDRYEQRLEVMQFPMKQRLDAV
jgi:hypothetical protein